MTKRLHSPELKAQRQAAREAARHERRAAKLAAKKAAAREPQAMRWDHGDSNRCFIQGKESVHIEDNDNGYIFAHPNDLEKTFPISFAEMKKIENDNQFKFEFEGRSLKQSRQALRSGIKRFRDLPKEERDLINWKEKIIKRFIQLKQAGLASLYDKSITNALDIIKKELQAAADKIKVYGGRTKPPLPNMPGPQAFRTWHNILVLNDMDKMSLRDDRCNSGNRKPRYGADEYAILFKYAMGYLSLEKPTIAMQFSDMIIEFTDRNKERRKLKLPVLKVPPDDGKLAALIAMIPEADKVFGREGEDIARDAFRSVDNGPIGVCLAMQRVELDAWMVHLYTLAVHMEIWEFLPEKIREEAIKVRMILTAAMCCESRCYVGLALTPVASGSSTLKVLRMMMKDKTAIARAAGCMTPWEYHARPTLVVFDAGPENANDDVITALGDMRINFTVPQAGMPTQRGKIERGFHTLDQKLVSRFSGRTMKNPAVRKKYQAWARGCVSVEELATIIVRFLVDDYHNAPHAGLGGKTPRQRWFELTAGRGLKRPPDLDEMRLVFGTRTEATLEPTGVLCLGNRYRSPALQALFEKKGGIKVPICYDHDELGWISFQDVDSKDKDWLTVPGPKAMRGVSAEAWMLKRAEQDRENLYLQKLVQPIRHGAQRAAIALDQHSRQRSGIMDSLATPDMVDAFHRHLSAGVIYDDEVDDDDGQPRDLFDGLIKAGTEPLTPRRNAPKPSKSTSSSKSSTSARSSTPSPDRAPAARQPRAKTAARKKSASNKARAKPSRATSSKHRQPKRRAEPPVTARARAKSNSSSSNQAPSNPSRRNKPTRAWTIKDPKR
jgi:putative transposase